MTNVYLGIFWLGVLNGSSFWTHTEMSFPYMFCETGGLCEPRKAE